MVEAMKHKEVKFSRYDTVDYLQTEEDIVEYLEAAAEDGDLALIAAALDDIARARNISQPAKGDCTTKSPEEGPHIRR